MEETWQAVFRNLYTGFLLRDFAGKIVPGVIFLFSIASMFRSPGEIFREIKKEVPVFAIVFIAGFAWTVTLGTQSLGEGLGVWKYFPGGAPQAASGAHVGFWTNLFYGGDETTFDANTTKVDIFQVDASEDQKQQYERFVVIKEACGNLFIAGLFSFPAWLVVFSTGRKPEDRSGSGPKGVGARRGHHGWDNWFKAAAPRAMACLYFVLVMVGLHRMNAQHVRRQMRYTEIVVENRKSRPHNPPTVTPQHPPVQTP